MKQAEKRLTTQVQLGRIKPETRAALEQVYRSRGQSAKAFFLLAAAKDAPELKKVVNQELMG